jgi:PAS domain S-box-containing protein
MVSKARQGWHDAGVVGLRLALLATAYFVLAKIGLALALIHPNASPVWAPSGVALSAILLWGFGMAPAIFAGALLANLEVAGAAAAIAIAAGNTLEACLTGWLLRRWSDGAATFDTPLGVARFAGFCLATGSLASATVGVTSLVLAGKAAPSAAPAIWTTWWLGDAGGQLLLTPALVLWLRSGPELAALRRAAPVYAAAAAVGLVAFSPALEQTGPRSAVAFLAIAPLLWAALDHGPRVTATAALILSGFAVWGTASGGGPFARADLNDSFLLLLSFAISTAVPSLVLSADAAARRRTEVMLRTANERSDRRVKRRTAALAHANRKLLEEVESRARLEAQLLGAQRLANLGSWSWDVATGRVTWSDQLFEIYGIRQEDFAGTFQDFLSRVHPDDRPQVEAAVKQAYTSGRDFRHEERIIRPDGQIRYLQSTGEAVRDAAGAVTQMIGICQDITEQRQARAALEEAREQLAQSQKMESIGQLTGGIAHDFNNLLTIIIGNLERLERQIERPGGDPGQIRQSASNALRGARRAAALTRQLLAFSRRQSLEPRPIDVNGLVSGMSDLLRRTLGERIEIRTALAPDLWQAYADPNQLEGALLNLAVNARDAMPDGGRLTIETANVSGNSRPPEAPAGSYVAIRMRDTGIGMTPEVAARAFEPFFTTKDVGQGTGLGLSQVYGFAKQSGGHVALESAPGKGTAVTLLLPRTTAGAEDTKPAHGAAASRPAAQPGGETVLVVEDDPDVRAHSVEMIRELGYRALEAGDARSALALLEREPAIAVLFSDVGLPGGMSGLQLAERALRVRPALRVLLVTGYARNAIPEGERLPAGVELMHKPFEFSALAAKLSTMLDARRPAFPS